MATAVIKDSQRGADLSKLTDQQRMFCLYMAASEDFNQIAAAREAHYKNPRQSSHQLMQVPAIQRFLGKIKREREERTGLTSDRIWEYMHRALFFDPATVYKAVGKGWWQVKSLEAMPQEHRELIEGIDVKSLKVLDQQVLVPIVKFVSKGHVLDIAARHAIPQKHDVRTVVVNWEDYYSGNGEVIDVDPIEARIAEEGNGES